jgi:predicted peroxiredoxin
MAGRVIVFLQHGSYEPAYQAASLGITAAAMGDEVYFVLAFDALRDWVRGDFGEPQTEPEIVESTRAEGLGMPPPSKMLEEAKALGAKVVVCDTTLKICGLTSGEVTDKITEVMGLASIWRLAEGARLISL